MSTDKPKDGDTTYTDRPRCKTCIFWDTQWDDEINAGHLSQESTDGGEVLIRECRRRSPSRAHIDSYAGVGRDRQASEMLKEGHGSEAVWLWTREDDWCGEHPDFQAYAAAERLKAKVAADGKCSPDRPWRDSAHGLGVRAHKTLARLDPDATPARLALPDMNPYNVRGCGITTAIEIKLWLQAMGLDVQWWHPTAGPIKTD